MNTPIEQNPNLPLGDHALHNADLASSFRHADLASQSSGNKVSAIFLNHQEAQLAQQTLIARGILASDITLLNEPTSAESASELFGETHRSDEVLKDVLVDGAIGTAVGTGVGVIGALMIVSGGITLFIASPVVAPLAMLGWFASVGGVIGTMVGANNKTKGKFSELVMDAVEAGNAVLIVQTHNEADTQLAKDIINLSLKGTDEVAAVDPI